MLVRKTESTRVLYADTNAAHQQQRHAQSKSKGGYCLETLAGGSLCESVHCGTLCGQAFSVALWDMRTADVTVSAVGWDFTGFLCFFATPVTEEVKNAPAPGVTQVILRNTGDAPAWKYIGCAINPLFSIVL